MYEGNMKVANFIRNSDWDEFPYEVKKQSKICTLDLLGAIIAGSRTKVSGIISELACNLCSGNEATVMMHGYKASLVGAVLANAFTANALDIDDGYRIVKGHPGSIVFPAVLAAAEKEKVSGKEFLTSLVVSYEVAIRAGLAWHDYHKEYHGTGSWGALGAAAGASRILSLNREEIINALGIAEYHAPIMPMMRCIDYPAMTKDGIGWGAMTGMFSTLMADNGFTGIPSLFGMPEYSYLIANLGITYEMLGLYFKPFACCRWAQPAVTAALKLRKDNSLYPDDIDSVVIKTFEAATRLSVKRPLNTEEAQYNMAFPVAAAFVVGEVGPRQVLDEYLNNDSVINFMNKISVIRDEKYDKEFPAKCKCEVKIRLVDGKTLHSGEMGALGDVQTSMGVEGIKEKFRWLTMDILGKKNVENIIDAVLELERVSTIESLIELLEKPPRLKGHKHDKFNMST